MILHSPLVLLLALSQPAAPPAQHPDVLFLAVDDLNDWVGCLDGHPQARTPHIDRLASRGTLFTNAHCQAPLCNPSRTSVLTGLRPSTTGIYGLKPGLRSVAATQDRPTLLQTFAAAGYTTSVAGKVFHDGAILPEGRASEAMHWGDSGAVPLPKAKIVPTPSPMRAVDWGVFPEDDRIQADWKIADAAIARLASPHDRPAFVAAGFRLPHVPCFASQRWFDLFPIDGLQLPPSPDDDRDDVPDFAWRLHWRLPEPRLTWLGREGEWASLVRAYLASTSFMDSQVGRVLDALDASGRASSTIVVLWSDHGWHLGEKGITGKNSLWERSTRVPLIVAGPGVAAGARCDQPVELLDLYPTLLDLAALPDPPGLQGHSLIPQLWNAQTPRPWPAITTHNQGNHAVRDARYRFIRYADGSEELYDHQTDPNEWRNLANDPKHQTTLRGLARWLPSRDEPPAPGSSDRILTRGKFGEWTWEGTPIDEVDRDR